MTWVRETVFVFELAGGDVLELGSYDVNGSVRELFHGRYVGVDIREGPGVDLVVRPGQVVPDYFATERFDIVVSTEMLEHDARPWETFPAIARALHRGGHLLLTCRGFMFGEHDYPADYWRFNDSSLRLLAEDAGLVVVELIADPDEASPGWFLHARRP